MAEMMVALKVDQRAVLMVDQKVDGRVEKLEYSMVAW